jgi:hypothetical protein
MLFAQAPDTFSTRVQQIMNRPEFAHSHFGIEFYSLDSGKPVFEFKPRELFVPGSTTKLLTEGTDLELLGGDYRFHTRIYRSGNMKKDGTLHGDLILVAAAILIYPVAFSPTERRHLKMRTIPTVVLTAKGFLARHLRSLLNSRHRHVCQSNSNFTGREVRFRQRTIGIRRRPPHGRKGWQALTQLNLERACASFHKNTIDMKKLVHT